MINQTPVLAEDENQQRVFVALVKKGELAARVLVIQRGPAANNAGQFGLPGGRVDDGETLIQAARRELKEELLMDLKLNGWRTISKGKRNVLVFPADNLTVKPRETGEAVNPQWMSAQQLIMLPQHLVHKSLRVFMDDAEFFAGQRLSKN
jgi:8-oxo-dGTP pyrophosphatase MutT (NUDIX family)